MLTRDSYVALLEKRAADAAESAVEPTDSVQLTTQEYRQNREDNRQYLHSIFPNAGEVESNQNATIKKLFDKDPTISGTALLKVAFYNAVGQTQFIKTASPIQIETAFSSFKDELEKISMTMGMGATPSAAPAMAPMNTGMKASPGATSAPVPKMAALKPQTLTQVAAKNQAAMKMPAKVWNIPSPAAAGGAGAKPGSGTSVHQGGILSRILGR